MAVKLRDILHIDATVDKEELKATLARALVHLMTEKPDNQLEEAVDEMQTVLRVLAELNEEELTYLSYTSYCKFCHSMPLIHRRVLGVSDVELQRREAADESKWEVVCLKCLRRRAEVSALPLSGTFPDVTVWKGVTTSDIVAVEKHYVPKEFVNKMWENPSFGVNVSEVGIQIPVFQKVDVQKLWDWYEQPERTKEELDELMAGLGYGQKKDRPKSFYKKGKVHLPFKLAWGNFYRGELYWQFTLAEGMQFPTEVLELLLLLKDIFQTWPLTNGSRTDFWRATLAFVGRKSMWTGLHADFAGAINVAFQLGGVLIFGKILAVWLFISPIVWVEPGLRAQLEAFFTEDMKCMGGPSMWNKVPLDRKSFAKLQQRLGDVDGQKKLAYVIEQKHGDIVHVLPGHSHFVYNVSPNVKFAFDYMDFRKADVYTEVWQKLHTQLAESNANDYIGGEVEIARMCFELLR
jgi:hypothetical protein